MAQHNVLGQKGEEIATAYLRDLGYEILDTNWRYGKDEIDIIAIDGTFLVIAEVKTRRSDFFGNPEEAVDRKKETFLIRAADVYIEQNDISLEVRYDILSVILEQGNSRITHIKDAFYATL